MRKKIFVVGALSLAAAVVAGGCSSDPGNQQSGSAGTASGAPGSGDGGAGRGAAGAVVVGSAGHTSGGSAMASSGSGGSSPSTANVYIDLLRTNVVNACFPRELPFGATGGANEGRVTCTIGELYFGACDCEQQGRTALTGGLLAAFEQRARESQVCDAATGVDCATACGCEVIQLPGTAVDPASELYECQNDVTPPTELAGYCVIDREHIGENGAAPIGSPEIVADCPAGSHRRIRFVGHGVPSTSAATFIACVSALGSM